MRVIPVKALGYFHAHTSEVASASPREGVHILQYVESCYKEALKILPVK